MKNASARYLFCGASCFFAVLAAWSAPVSSSARQPAEFEPQAAVWLAADPDNAEFMKVTVELVKSLLPHVKVKLFADTDGNLGKAKAVLQQHGIAPAALEYHADPLATFFMRDGAVYLVDAHGAMSVLDLKWSDYGLPGWCRRLLADKPERAAKCAGWVDAAKDELDRWIAKTSGVPVLASPLFLENATFEVNGKGVLLISESLALERNEPAGRDEIERELRVIPGVKKVIWLGEGVAQDPLEVSTITGRYVGMGAGGHTDEFVRFVDPSTILLAWQEDDGANVHPLHRINRERMQKNYDILAHSTDQDGRPFRIIKVPMPAVIERKVVLASRAEQGNSWNEASFPPSEGRKAGDEVIQVAAATYLNFLIANEVVLVPSFVEDGTSPAVQDRVRHIFEDALPGRKIQFVHCTPLMWQGGGLHCATLSEPKSNKLAENK